MKTQIYAIVYGLLLATGAQAQFYHIEPDNYTNGTLLNTILPQVSLVTARSNNTPIPFDVQATYDPFGFAPTGSNVFANAPGVYFWNSDRRLRMDFSSTVGFISIDFAGGQYFTNETGRLDAFNSIGQLIASYTTSPKGPGTNETMTVVRPQLDIAYAVAYIPPNLGSFGRLDNLVFSPVPEPATSAILLLCGGLWIAFSRESRKRA